MRMRWPTISVGVVSVLLALSVFSTSAEGQQTGRVTGTVRAAETQQPLGGAQVFLQRLRLGTLSNDDGRFLILNVPVGTHTIRVEMLGYGAQEVTITVGADQPAVVDFVLGQTAVALEELVVTGTAAEVRAREIGNALDAVTSRELENVPVANPEDILGGRIPGVTVMQSSGQPGTAGTIRIRGQNTASQTTEPLVYIDGVRVFNEPVSLGQASRQSISPLQDINAEDIERIEVVKGAAATTLYGTEASGGVIQIFTKRGVSGEPIWNAEVGYGFLQQGEFGPDGDPTNLYTKCGNLNAFYGLSQSSSSAGEKVYFQDVTCPSGGDWFELGPQSRYSLSVRGGSGDVTYYVSGSFDDTEGTLPTQRSRDGGFRGNFDFSPVEGLNLALNTAYTRRDSRFVEDGNNADGFLLNVGRGTNGNFKGGKGEDCDGVDILCVSNGYLFDSENTSISDRYTMGFVINYLPTESLSNRFSVGWDNLTVTNEEFQPWGYLRNTGGFYSVDRQFRQKLSLDYAGSFRNSFGDDLMSTLSWGGQVFRDRFRNQYDEVEDFAGPGAPTLESGGSRPTGDAQDDAVAETNAGFFLQEVLGWQDRLFLTAGLRVDGNSAFGDDFGLQTYPKASLAYVLSDYDFWPRDWVETFKLRAALGESGKAPGAFDKLRTWTPVSHDDSKPGFTPNEIGNEDIGPERTREIELGFDASAFQGRLGLEATYYQAKTTDALVPVTYPPSNGFLASRTENVGELKTSGLEFQISGILYQNSFIDWTARVNLAFMDSEAVDLNGQLISGDNKAEIREGAVIPVYVGRVITNPNEFADPEYESNQIIGPVNPQQLYGVSTSLTLWDQLTADVLVEHQGGHYLPQYTGYQNGRRGAWYPCFPIQAKIVAFENGDASALDDVKAIDRAKCAMNAYGGYNSDYWVEPADFWKLRTVALTYRIPEEFVSRFATRATVTLSGRNLHTWTDYSGVDPEVEDFADRAEYGIFDGASDYGRREYYNLPTPRQWLLSFRVTF